MRQSFNQYRKIHESSNDGRTAGQRFCDMFLEDRTAIPGLLDERDDEIAYGVIKNWLNKQNHKRGLPPRVR